MKQRGVRCKTPVNVRVCQFAWLQGEGSGGGWDKYGVKEEEEVCGVVLVFILVVARQVIRPLPSSSPPFLPHFSHKHPYINPLP